MAATDGGGAAMAERGAYADAKRTRIAALRTRRRHAQQQHQ